MRDLVYPYSSVSDALMDESVFRCSSKEYSMTSSYISDETSIFDDLYYVDRAVNDIMNNSGLNKENYTNDIMKFVIKCHHGRKEEIRQEIAFLSADSTSKNSTIDHLFNQLHLLQQNYPA